MARNFLADLSSRRNRLLFARAEMPADGREGTRESDERLRGNGRARSGDLITKYIYRVPTALRAFSRNRTIRAPYGVMHVCAVRAPRTGPADVIILVCVRAYTGATRFPDETPIVFIKRPPPRPPALASPASSVWETGVPPSSGVRSSRRKIHTNKLHRLSGTTRCASTVFRMRPLSSDLRSYAVARPSRLRKQFLAQ